jgi:hypothetical protein
MRQLLLLVGYYLLLMVSTKAVACSEFVLPTSAAENAKDIYVGYVTALRSLEPGKWPSGAYEASVTVTKPLKGRVIKILNVKIPESCSLNLPHVDERVVVIRWDDATSYVSSLSSVEMKIKAALIKQSKPRG